MVQSSVRSKPNKQPSSPRLLQARAAQAYEQLAHDHLRHYIRQAWSVVEPGTPFVSGWHIDVIAEYLQGITDGHIQNLILNMPPRHMKSLSVAVFWPTWEWIHKPWLRYIAGSYIDRNAIRDTVYARRLIQDPWYQQRYGESFQLAWDQNRKTRYDNDQGGFRMATSVGAGITGEGGHRLLVDDPNRAEDATSPRALEDTAWWWDKTMSTRGNDPSITSRIIVQQRVHEKDLSGHVIDSMEDPEGRYYETLILPAEYNPKRRQSFSLVSRKTGEKWMPKTGAGKKSRRLEYDPRTREGEPLWPGKMPESEIRSLKSQLKNEAPGQLNQHPVPPEGDVFKEHWFRYYEMSHDRKYVTLSLDHEDVRIPTAGGTVFSTSDLAVSVKQTADHTVICSWMWIPAPRACLLWLGMRRGRYEGPDLVPNINAERIKWGASFVGIEKAGFQLDVIQSARRRGMPVVELHPDGDKRSRAIPASIMMEGQQLFFPGGNAPFVSTAQEELLKFTGSDADDDDIVDNFGYAAWVANFRLQSRQRKRKWGRR